VLIIGQPDKMLRVLRNSKGSTELSATSMWIVVSADNHNVLKLRFSLCMSECLAEVRDTSRSMLHCSPFKHLLLDQPQPEALSHHCLLQPADSQYLHKSCSLSPLALQHNTKTNTALFCRVAI
jgi:hypothetical protein